MSADDPTPPRQALLVEHHYAQAGRLSGFLTHELNNQLAAISGYAELLSQKPAAAPFAKELGRILQAGDRARELIEHFREATTVATEVTPVNVGLALQTALRARGFEFTKRNITVEVTVAEDLPTQLLQPTHIQLALGALLDNAYEAMAPFGSGTLNIAVRRLGERGSAVTLTNVPGGDPPAAPQAWLTGKDPQKHAGLGLTVARWVAEAAGGICEIASGANGQTQVEWTMPGPAPAASA